MFEKNKPFAPTTGATRAYGSRSAKSVKFKIDQMSTEFQGFRDSLRFIRAAQPTGATKDGVLSMAIAKHLPKRDCLSYNALSYPPTVCKFHLGYKALCFYSNFSDANSTSGAPTSNVEAVDNSPAIKDSSNPTPTATASALKDSIPEPGDSNSGATGRLQGSITVPLVENRVNDVSKNEIHCLFGQKLQNQFCQNDSLCKRGVMNAARLSNTVELRNRTFVENKFLCFPTPIEIWVMMRKKMKEPSLYVCFESVKYSVCKSRFLTVMNVRN